jgi:hypothetical protein
MQRSRGAKEKRITAYINEKSFLFIAEEQGTDGKAQNMPVGTSFKRATIAFNDA